MIKIMEYGAVKDDEIFARGTAEKDVSGVVKEIIDDVVKRGDKALFELTAKFDKAELTSLEVSAEEINEAFSLMDDDFIRIRSFG